MARTRTPSRTARTILWLERRADRPWFLPAAGAFPLGDYLLPFLPNQMLLVALAMIQPRRWWQFAASFVIATALGAFLAALAIQHWGQPLVDRLIGDMPPDGTAAGLRAAIDRYGLLALAGISMLPWPPRTAVVICALAGLPPVGMALSVGAGRTLPIGLYALAGARAPHLLRRWRRLDAVLREVEAERMTARAAG